MTLDRKDPRVSFYGAVRDLLAASKSTVPTCVELGAGGGAGRAYLGENVSYLGLDKTPGRYACGVVVQRGDWVKLWPYPTGHFDVAACFDPESRGPIGSVVFRAKEAVKRESGVAVFGWALGGKGDPETDRVTKRAFKDVRDVPFGRARVRVCAGAL